MTTLDLVLKGQWFRMIESGEKKDEYRAITPYWIRRLIRPLNEMDADVWDELCHDLAQPETRHRDYIECMSYFNVEFKVHDDVRFRLGYAKDSERMLYLVDNISIGPAKPEWSGNWQGNVFRIHLGERIN